MRPHQTTASHDITGSAYFILVLFFTFSINLVGQEGKLWSMLMMGYHLLWRALGGVFFPL